MELRVVLFYKFPLLFPKEVCLDGRPGPVVVTAPFLIAALEAAYHCALWLSKDVDLFFVYLKANIVLAFANEVDFSHIVKFTVDSMTLAKLDGAQVL